MNKVSSGHSAVELLWPDEAQRAKSCKYCLVVTILSIWLRFACSIIFVNVLFINYLAQSNFLKVCHFQCLCEVTVCIAVEVLIICTGCHLECSCVKFMSV